MIVSPRAKEVTEIFRIAGGRLIEIDRVFLYRRVGDAYEKIDFWDRDQDNSEVDPGVPCRCDHKPCVILAEADFDPKSQTFDPTVRVLDGEGNVTGDIIHLDHIVVMEDNS